MFQALAFALAASSCSRPTPRDVGNENPRSAFVDGPRHGIGAVDGGESTTTTNSATARGPATGAKPREIAKANSRAIALSATHVYFGDEADDALYSLPKVGNTVEPDRLARHAPMPGALSYDASSSVVAWIGTPGDVVLRLSIAPLPSRPGRATTVRDRAIFTDVVVDAGDVFFSEAHGTTGALGRVTGTTAAQLATFEGSPRGISVEGQSVYIATTASLLVTSRTRGEVRQLASGAAFGSPAVFDGWVYAAATQGAGAAHAIVRVRESGGALEVVVRGVRDAPFALQHGALYWFDAERPALLTMPVPSRETLPRPTRTLSEDVILEHPAAIAVDDNTAFIATGFGSDARIVTVPLR